MVGYKADNKGSYEAKIEHYYKKIFILNFCLERGLSRVWKLDRGPEILLYWRINGHFDIVFPRGFGDHPEYGHSHVVMSRYTSSYTYNNTELSIHQNCCNAFMVVQMKLFLIAAKNITAHQV